jgi:DNA-binding CsgD family transcriptional regulator
MSAAALLANDLPTLRAVVEAADRVERISPGIEMWAVNARHRLDLITGDDSSSQWLLREPDARWPLTTATMWLLGRESIDAGETNAAVAGVRDWATLSPESPHAQAVIAAIEAAATNDEDRWHDALVDAVDHGFRLIAVDALEGIAGAAARAENWGEGERLLAAAQRLRDETGYRWRFGFEQRAVDAAHTAALDALGAEGPACAAQGNELDWHEAAEYARRARGERKRPRSGWASITPTEHHVIALVAEGLSNPQIAEQLFMGRATVKSHLDHVFAKLGMRSRAQIAAEVARRSSTPTRDNNDI